VAKIDNLYTSREVVEGVEIIPVTGEPTLLSFYASGRPPEEEP
jgi:hypothetical protein